MSFLSLSSILASLSFSLTELCFTNLFTVLLCSFFALGASFFSSTHFDLCLILAESVLDFAPPSRLFFSILFCLCLLCSAPDDTSSVFLSSDGFFVSFFTSKVFSALFLASFFTGFVFDVSKHLVEPFSILILGLKRNKLVLGAKTNSEHYLVISRILAYKSFTSDTNLFQWTGAYEYFNVCPLKYFFSYFITVVVPSTSTAT
jgi:hypothetical protein